MKTLEVQHAEINTAVVTVQTLTISKKQVTLAVFRQLPDEKLICHEGKMMGVPWGRVNYHPGDCDKERSHHHVVWQKGNELRRAEEAQPGLCTLNCQTIFSANPYLLAMLAGGWKPEGQPKDFGYSFGWHRDSRYPRPLRLDIGGAVVAISLDDHHRSWLVDPDRTMEDEDGRWIDKGGGVRTRASDLRGTPSESADTLRGYVIEQVRQETRIHAAKRDAYKSISDLPQLYIAV